MSSGGAGSDGPPAVPEGPLGGEPLEPADPDARGEPIGPFPTWKALYITVLVWWVFLVVLLRVFTVVFDHGAP